MTEITSAGQRFRNAVSTERPLQIAGTINAFCALLAEQAGFKAIYLSGAGVANGSYGLPDLGLTSLDNVLEDVRRITAVTDVPLLVDIDTGWGNVLGIERTVQQMIAAGAGAVHLEDQVAAKRCGHRPGKALVDATEMCDRIRAANSGRTDPQFVIMARTDSAANEGLDAAIKRANDYLAAGADMIFAEALTSQADFKTFATQVNAPVLANMTEFGKSPLLTTDQLNECGIAMALYPLSAFRAMSKAAAAVYQTLKADGIQTAVIDQMQTRDELYKVLDYLSYEQRIDQLHSNKETQS